MTEPHAPPGILFVADIARICTVEAQKAKPGRGPIRPATIRSYLKESRSEHGRYARNPAPMPDGYAGGAQNTPWWYEPRGEQWRTWWNSRPTGGHGTTRLWKTPARQALAAAVKAAGGTMGRAGKSRITVTGPAGSVTFKESDCDPRMIEEQTGLHLNTET